MHLELLSAKGWSFQPSDRGTSQKPPHSSKPSTLCAPWKEENIGFTLIQIYYGRTHNCFITAGLEGDSRMKPRHSKLQCWPSATPPQGSTETPGGERRHPPTDSTLLNQRPSDLTINNSTLQGQTERGHRSKEEVLVHLFFLWVVGISSFRHVY